MRIPKSAPKKALLINVVLGLLLFSGCSDISTENSAGDEEKLAAFTKGNALPVSSTDSPIPGMKGIADNGKLQLLVDEEVAAVAIVHKESGQIWFSNPTDRDSDNIAMGVNKDLLSAQLKIDFYNSTGQINSMNSYSDSVAKGQMAFEPMEHGFRVTYQFGTDQRTAEDLPLMLSKTRFDELSGKLDRTGQRALLVAYKEDTDKGTFTRNDSSLSGMTLQRAFEALENAGYTEEELEADMKELGFTQTQTVPRIFQAAIEYELDGDSLVVRIPQASIHFPEAYPINMISLLGSFGAGGADESGSLLVPDGSGALIHFNNGKAKYPAYQQSVYGTDRTMDTSDNPAREEEARLPVFGILREHGAFLGIIEEGAPVATVNADVAGRTNSYNTAYPSFIVVNKGEVTLDGGSKQRTLPKFQESPSKTDFTVRYTFLNEDEATYGAMAQIYRQRLLETGGLPNPAIGSGGEAAFYLQLIGGISQEKHFAGIPYQAIEPLTTFDQAESIVTLLQQRDINEIKLKYSGWFNGGQNHKVPEKIEVDSEIGGRKGLESFSSFAREQNLSFYPDFAVLTAESTSGFSKSDDAARTLRGVPAALYPLDLSLDRRDRSRQPAYVVSPRLVESYIDSIVKEMKDNEISGISLRDLADKLDTDYRKNRQIDRTESEKISVEALARLSDAGLTIMGEGGNAYALPYLSDITNAPLSNSGFKIEDTSIPFYQMVIRGAISYSGAPYNLSTHTNDRQYVLKCLEYGANVSFEWIYEPNYQMKDTEFSELYAVHYSPMVDQAAAMYKEVQEVLSEVQGQSIIAHEELQEGVYKTVYQNNLYVIVNYNSSPASVDGRTVEAESYVVGGKGI